MKASEWIDRVKAAKGLQSDYGVAKVIGLTRSAVSNYRVGARPTLDEESALKVAEALGERPEAVYLDQVAERTKSPALREALSRAATALCILCKVVAAPKFVV